MKLTVTSEEFKKAVDWVTVNSNSKDEKAYLAFIADFENGKLSLAYMDRVSYSEAPVAVSQESWNVSKSEKGNKYKVALDPVTIKNASSAIKKLKDDSVIFSYDFEKKGSFFVESEKLTLEIPTLELKIKDRPNLLTLGTVEVKSFVSAIDKLGKICTLASADNGSATGSVALRFNKNSITAAATDSFAFGEIVVDNFSLNKKHFDKFVENSTNGGIALVPKSCTTLIKTSNNKDSANETLDLVFDPDTKRFGYSLSDGRIIVFSLDEARPIPYENFKAAVLAQSDKQVVLSSCKNVKEGVDVAKLFDVSSPYIVVKINKDKVSLLDENERNEVQLESVSGNFKGTTKFKLFTEIFEKALAPFEASSAIAINFAESFRDGVPEVTCFSSGDNEVGNEFSIAVLEVSE